MKMYCCYTASHEPLFERCFRPSLPADFELMATKLESTGVGDFRTPEFLRCITQKIDLILESLEANWGELIVWTDIDIQFFCLTTEVLRREIEGRDMALQAERREGNEVNTGFFVCRCNERVREFFCEVARRLERTPGVNEQFVINEMFAEVKTLVTWKRLSLAFYARTHGWPPPRDLVLYHANATMGAGGVGKKVRQFRELEIVRKYGLPAALWFGWKNGAGQLALAAGERLAAAGRRVSGAWRKLRLALGARPLP